ncbi:MAG: hypothetical protein ACYC7H_08195, partial [Chloroflexota bacterium]
MEPLRLTVPHYFQEHGVPLCSLWSLKMLYEYHGLYREVPDLLAEVQRIPTGVYVQEIGRHALANGFAATLTTADVTRLPPFYARQSREEIVSDLRERIADEEVDEKKAVYLSGIIRFLEAGGKLRLQPPTLDDPIRRDLADGYPVICSIDMKALYGEKGLDAEWPASYRVGQVGHYVVVSGL